MGRLQRLLLLLAAPVAVVIVVALARAAWDRGTPVDVLYREDGRDVLLTTRDDALERLGERVGFRPALPDPLPLEDISLSAVDSLLGPPDTGKPRSRLEFVRRTRAGEAAAPQLLLILQSEAYWGPGLDGWEQRAIPGGAGVEIWEFPYPDAAPVAEYWIVTPDTSIYVSIIGFVPSDEEVDGLLQELASRGAKP